MMQGELFRREARLEREWRAFHAANPQVYAALVREARVLLARGHKRLGVGMLWEVLRWQRMLHTTDPAGWKLNNNHRSRYARLMMEQEPDLRGVFETRELHDGEDE